MANPFNLPPLGENVDAGTVVGILVAVGDPIEVDQSVLEIETDKANLEVPSSVSGVVTEILVKNGDQAVVGQPVLMVDADGAGEVQKVVEEVVSSEETTMVGVSKPEPESSPESQLSAEAPAPSLPAAAPAAPSVRRFSREIGIDIHQVPGSGPGGRISIDDVKAYAKQRNSSRPTAAVGGAMPAVSLPDFARWGEVTPEAMSNLRRAAAEHLGAAWVNIPHVTYADKADITALEALRKKFGPKAEAAGGKLTMTAIALKFAAAALKKFPMFNASIDMAKQEIIYKSYYHIGVAVDTDRGLVVPVIRDVDQKNIIELVIELSEVAVKARDRKLSLEDMQGGSFTISNLGGFGGSFFTPIVNAPDVAILGIARGRIEPVYSDGEFQPRLMLPLMISYDHRVIDGADGARFMQWLVQAFEQPFLLILEG